jgi:hypothetical protein
MKTQGSVDQIHGRALQLLLETTDLRYAVKKVQGGSNCTTVFWQGGKPPLKLVGMGAGLSGETLRGNSFLDVIYDEASLLPIMKLHNEIIGPRLDYRTSSEMCIFTPKGKASEMYKVCELAGDSAFHYTSYANPFRSKMQLDELQRSLTPKKFNQEIMASWEDFDGVVLSYFDRIATPVQQFDNYVMAIDPGAVNPAACVLGYSAARKQLQCISSWSSQTGAPVTQAELVDQLHHMAAGYKIERLYVPDDRPDLVPALLLAGFPAKQLGRNSKNVKPAARADLLNTLLYKQRLSISEGQDSFIDELSSLHRATDPHGQVTNEIAKGQTQHRYDALGYAVSGLMTSLPQLHYELLQ